MSFRRFAPHPAHSSSVQRTLRLRRICAAALLATTAALRVHAAGDASLAADARKAMENATAFMRSISAEGGYLWRYSPDLKERAGERPATATQIWVQPPGTPSMGMAFLRAYEVTRDARYLDAARAAALALATGQLASGGWDYVIDFDPQRSTDWYRRTDVGKISAAEAAKRKNVSTFDDDTTQSALRFLVAFLDAAKGSPDPRDAEIRTARDYGLAKLVEAQRPNGGWPQRWNGTPVDPQEYPVQSARIPQEYPREHPRQNYYSYYTLNDHTHTDCVQTLLDAAKRLGRAELRAAALRGGDFLLRAQLPEPQPAWAQQYNPQLEPAWARAFEPPCVVSNESAAAMRLLIDLYLETGDAKYLEPLPRAIAWFKRSELSPGVWARMYELGTNTPIYGDRDGKIKYRVEDLSPERQTGYSWKGDYGIPDVMRYYESVHQAGREAVLKQRETAKIRAKSSTQRAAHAKSIAPRVRTIIGALDEQGRWLSRRRGPEQISTQEFITNLRVLSDYIEAVK